MIVIIKIDILFYGAETKLLEHKYKNKWLGTKMHLLRRSLLISKLNKNLKLDKMWAQRKQNSANCTNWNSMVRRNREKRRQNFKEISFHCITGEENQKMKCWITWGKGTRQTKIGWVVNYGRQTPVSFIYKTM